MAEPLHNLHREIQTMLRQIHDSGILAEDDALLTQSFIEGETNVPEMIDAVLASIDTDTILLSGIDKIVDEYATRKKRIKERVEAKRGLIELAMIRTEIDKLETPRATVSLRRVPRHIDSIDEAEIPSEYFAPQPPKLDKGKLLADLRDGKDVPGAKLDNGGVTLSLRRH